MQQSDDNAIRDEIHSLHKELRSVRYLIKMEKISRIDRTNPLVRKQEDLESRVHKLLVMVRHIQQHR